MPLRKWRNSGTLAQVKIPTLSLQCAQGQEWGPSELKITYSCIASTAYLQVRSASTKGGAGDWLKSKLSNMLFAIVSLPVSEVRPNRASVKARNDENS